MSQFVYDNIVYFEFHSTYFCVKDHMIGQILLKGTLHNGLYKFDIDYFKFDKVFSSIIHVNVPINKSDSFLCSFNTLVIDLSIWHQRLCHPFSPIEKKVLTQCKILFVNDKDLHFCTCCISKS